VLARDDRAVCTPGLFQGGSGIALFLLHVYELTTEERFLAGAEWALRRDLALLGWAPLAEPGAPALWRQRPTFAGSGGVGMVLHEGMNFLDASWVYEAHESIAATCEQRLVADAGLFHGWSGTLVALQYMRSRPWEPEADRRDVVRPHLARLLEPVVRHGVHALGMRSAGVAAGSAGMLLALHHLAGERHRRLPLFW
jgi:hypothetical protein